MNSITPPLVPKYANVLKWLSEGKDLQVVHKDGWVDCTSSYALEIILKSTRNSCMSLPSPAGFRIRPDTIVINDIRLPANTREAFDSSTVTVKVLGSLQEFHFQSEDVAYQVFDALCKPFYKYPI